MNEDEDDQSIQSLHSTDPGSATQSDSLEEAIEEDIGGDDTNDGLETEHDLNEEKTADEDDLELPPANNEEYVDTEEKSYESDFESNGEDNEEVEATVIPVGDNLSQNVQEDEISENGAESGSQSGSQRSQESEQNDNISQNYENSSTGEASATSGDQNNLQNSKLKNIIDHQSERLVQWEELATTRKQDLTVLREELREKDNKIMELSKKNGSLNITLHEQEDTRNENLRKLMDMENQTLKLKMELESLKSTNNQTMQDLIRQKETKFAAESNLESKIRIEQQKVISLQEKLEEVEDAFSSHKSEVSTTGNELQKQLALREEEIYQYKVAEANFSKQSEVLQANLAKMTEKYIDLEAMYQEKDEKHEAELKALKEEGLKQLAALRREAAERQENFDASMFVSEDSGDTTQGRGSLMNKTALVSKISELRKENRMLTEEYQNLLYTVEVDAPKVKRLKDDYDDLIREFDVISRLRNEAEFKRDKFKHGVTQLEKERDLWEAERNSLLQTQTDLKSQLTHLLQPIHPNNENQADNKLLLKNYESAADVISDRLVPIDDADDLLSKYTTLLAAYRKACDDLEVMEGERNTEAENAEQVSKLNEIVETLTKKRETQEKIIKSITQQRDSYKSVLEDRENSGQDNSSELKSLQQKFERLMQETTQLKETVKAKQKELTHTTALNAQTSSACDSLKQKLVSLEAKLMKETSSCDKLKINLRSTQMQLEAAQTELSTIRNNLQLKEDTLEAMTTEKKASETELMQKKITCEVQAKEIIMLESKVNDLKEQNTQNQRLLHSLKLLETVEASRGTNSLSDLQDRLEEKKEELADALSRLSILRNDAELDKQQLSLELRKLSGQLQEETASKAELETRRRDLEETVKVMQAKQDAMREELDEAKTLNQQIRLLNVSQVRNQLDTDSTLPDSAEVLKLKNSIKHAKEALEAANEDIELYKAMAEANEKSLADVRSLSNAERSQDKAELSKLREENEQLNSKIESIELLQTDLEEKRATLKHLTVENEELKKEILEKESVNNSLQDSKRISQNETELQTLQSEEVSSELQRLRQTKIDNEAEIDNLKARVSQTESIKAKAEVELTENLSLLKKQNLQLEESEVSLKKEIQVLSATLTSQNVKLRQLQRLQAGVDVNQEGGEITESAEIQRLNDLVDLTTEKTATLTNEKTQLQNELEDIMERYRAASAELAESRIMSEALTKRLEDMDIESTNHKIRNLEENNTTLLEMNEESQVKIAELKKAIATKNTEISELQEAAQALKQDIEAKSSKEEQHAVELNRISEMEKDITDLKEKLEEKTKALADAEAALQLKKQQFETVKENVMKFKNMSVRLKRSEKELREQNEALEKKYASSVSNAGPGPATAVKPEAASDNIVVVQPSKPASEMTAEEREKRMQELLRQRKSKKKKQTRVDLTVEPVEETQGGKIEEQLEAEKLTKRKMRFEAEKVKKKVKFAPDVKVVSEAEQGEGNPDEEDAT